MSTRIQDKRTSLPGSFTQGLGILLVLFGCLGADAAEQTNQLAQVASWDTFSDTWVATDGLGRSLPGAEVCGAPRPGKVVGIFYFLWLEGQGPVYDLTKLLAKDPAQPAYGPPHAFHFWGEPLFGYYRSDDEWVIRKHASLLADAGIDVIIFDVTNGFTYDHNYLTLCRVFTELRRQGLRTPQIAFIAHSGSDKVVRSLYQNFYSKNLYPDLWFRWQGKPLFLASPKGLDERLTNFFTLRESWAWTDPRGWFGEGRDKWPWLDHTPQKPGWHDSPAHPEQIPVAVAEHPTSNIGRSFHQGSQPPPGQTATDQGLYFAEQWQRALKVDPEFVFVTGWNEWIAQRFLNEGNISLCGRKLERGETFFVDQYSREFSRDIEPMQGGHGDAYYYQLVGAVRRFKGVRPLPVVVSRPIVIDGRFEDWREVEPEFRDTLGDTAARQHPGWKGEPPFVENSGRNDIVAAKVSADATNLYFYVRTREALTPCSDSNWMLLFLDTDQNPRTGWLGYDFVLNRANVRAHTTTLQRHAGDGYHWETVAEVFYQAAGNELEVAIPRAALGLSATTFAFDFKWTDNTHQTGDASDFLLHGDVAPNGRFNFRVKFASAAGMPKP